VSECSRENPEPRQSLEAEPRENSDLHAGERVVAVYPEKRGKCSAENERK